MIMEISELNKVIAKFEAQNLGLDLRQIVQKAEVAQSRKQQSQGASAAALREFSVAVARAYPGLSGREIAEIISADLGDGAMRGGAEFQRETAAAIHADRRGRPTKKPSKAKARPEVPDNRKASERQVRVPLPAEPGLFNNAPPESAPRIIKIAMDPRYFPTASEGSKRVLRLIERGVSEQKLQIELRDLAIEDLNYIRTRSSELAELVNSMRPR